MIQIGWVAGVLIIIGAMTIGAVLPEAIKIYKNEFSK